MKPDQFLKTVYLGDRYCTKLVLDGCNHCVEIHVNQISRIRDKTGVWNYYIDEDIENWAIVITGVKAVYLDDSGFMPNDEIDIYASESSDGYFEFVIDSCHVDDEAETHNLVIKVVGKGVHLIDPARPNQLIID
ncbi:MAG: DUF6258 family protein [Candidatus Saccharibacteria bacterium]